MFLEMLLEISQGHVGQASPACQGVLTAVLDGRQAPHPMEVHDMVMEACPLVVQLWRLTLDAVEVLQRGTRRNGVVPHERRPTRHFLQKKACAIRSRRNKLYVPDP